jgi:hypothetical protein
MLQAKSKGKVCVHALPRATAAPEPASLLREGSDAATCPRLRTPPLRLGGLRCCHVPRGSGPRLTIQEESDTAMRPSAPDSALPPKRAPALTRVLRLRTAPASEMSSGADIHGTPRAVGHRGKGRLSCNGMKRGSRVSKTRLGVTEAPTRRVGRRRYHDLQTV